MSLNGNFTSVRLGTDPKDSDSVLFVHGGSADPGEQEIYVILQRGETFLSSHLDGPLASEWTAPFPAPPADQPPFEAGQHVSVVGLAMEAGSDDRFAWGDSFTITSGT